MGAYITKHFSQSAESDARFEINDVSSFEKIQRNFDQGSSDWNEGFQTKTRVPISEDEPFFTGRVQKSNIKCVFIMKIQIARYMVIIDVSDGRERG